MPILKLQTRFSENKRYRAALRVGIFNEYSKQRAARQVVGFFDGLNLTYYFLMYIMEIMLLLKDLYDSILFLKTYCILRHNKIAVIPKWRL